MRKKFHFKPLQIYKTNIINDISLLTPLSIIISILHNNKPYKLNISFSKHATERLYLRCFSHNEVINIIKKGFHFILSDAYHNKRKLPEKRLKTLIFVPDKCKLILSVNWNSRKTVVNISVITLLLDYQRPYDSFKKKDTIVHYLQYYKND